MAGVGASWVTRRPASAQNAGARVHEVTLVAKERLAALPALPGKPSSLYVYGDDLFRTLRIKIGDRIRATLENRLPEHSSIHWHGVRVGNGADGVPWLTQPPTRPGERYTYDFAPPDAGT